MNRVAAWDQRTFDRLAAARVPSADRALPRLSRAANHSKLWAAAALGLAATGNPRARRAALRGIAATALASATVNSAFKWAFGRSRPLLDTVPMVRQLRRQPASPSFPSGHAASAAAFTAGVALESPRLAAALAPVAGAVALSRVYTGVHYPTDVLAGLGLGLGAAYLTHRWWPARPQHPATTRGSVELPALPEGAGLRVVANPAAGRPGGTVLQPMPLAEQLQRALPQAVVTVSGVDGTLTELLDRAAAEAACPGGSGAIGAAGGDGTVNAAARVALRHGLALAVFPTGTLNHFAADLGVEGIAEVAEAVGGGHGVLVDVGRVRDAAAAAAAAEDDAEPYAVFLNTFSTGVYPELVRTRETAEGTFGKWPAAALGLIRVLRNAQPLQLTVQGRPCRIWLLFAGNGRYAPEGCAPSHRTDLAGGLLDLRLLDASRPAARTRLLLAVLTGALGRSTRGQTSTHHLPHLHVAGLQNLPATCDGELLNPPNELLLDTSPTPLRTYRPTPDAP